MTASSAGKQASWPIGTLLLLGIASIVFAFIALGRFTSALEYVVYFEKDIQPLQWVTSLFIHANVLQLISLMVFLVLLGSSVEARVGQKWTITLFLGLGIAGQALAQMALLDAKPGGVSLGAGAGICGWAGLLLIWGPLDKLNQIGKVKLSKFSLPVWALVLVWLFADAAVSSIVLGPISLFPQFISLLAGACVGAVLLKYKVVEGENQDLLTMISGTGPGGRKERRKLALLERAQAEKNEHLQQQVASAQAQLDAYLSTGQLTGALTLLSKMAESGVGLQVSQSQMTTIIRGLHKQSKWEESIPWLQQYLERFPQDVAQRLKLAQIFIVNQRLPGSGMEVLKPLNDAQLPEAEAKLLRKLEHAACNMYEDDDIELELEKRAW